MSVSEKAMNFLVMCIGNRDGGDDAVGPYIADKLKERKADFEVIDCGTVPENYTSVVKRFNPEVLVIIDAVEMSLDPGEIRIIPKEKIGVMHISTHGIPISVLINYLERHAKNIFLVGIQPQSMSGEMSDSVVKKAEELVKTLLKKNININLPKI
jgi:hydrogenase 3 maturation protease